MDVALLTYSTRARGGVVHTLALAEALARDGVSVTVYTLGRGGDEAFFRPVDPAVAVSVVPFPDLPDREVRDSALPGSTTETVGERVVRSIEVLGAAVDPGRHDIVHAQDCISANAVPGSIRTVHHIDTFSTPQLVACHERAIVNPTTHVCVSAAVAGELHDGWGIEATVIPNGVDAERFAAAAGPSAASARARWRDEIGGRYVLVVGGIEPRKGTIDLADAMADLRAHHPDVRLVIAGGETLFDYRDYRQAFDERCAEAGVEPIVLGPVDHDVLPSLVAAADVFAFPSTKEGFGLAAMEALAAGVPVVARDLPVLHEVFGDTVRYGSDPSGFAAALADALEHSGFDSHIDPGRALAGSLSWAAAATAHRHLYESVLASR